MGSVFYNLLLLAHFLITVGLIVVVLLQADKGVGLSGAFGGGASHTVFGAGGSLGFLGKLTTSIAVAFMITSFSLYLISARSYQAPPSNLAPQSQGQERPTVPSDLPGVE
jgi:preprotein translocase subunit SecG